jgi:thiamine kinase-like enzyme
MHFDFDKNLLCEDLLLGLPFTKISITEQVSITKKLLIRLTSSPDNDLPLQDFDKWFENFDVLLKSKSSNKEICFDFDILEQFRTVKSTWIHGDLFGENMVVQAGLSEVLIDFDKVEVAPAFTELFTLFIFEARSQRPALLEAFFDGCFDEYFNHLGLNISNSLENKYAMFLAWLSWKQVKEEFEDINIVRFYAVINTQIERLKGI